MIFRNLDADNDWNFGKGINDYAKDADAVALNVKTRLQMWLNDCFFAQDEGIDWINRLGSKSQENLLDLDIRNIILKTEDVTGIIDFSTSLEDRIFTANYSFNTTFGTTITDAVTRGL